MILSISIIAGVFWLLSLAFTSTHSNDNVRAVSVLFGLALFSVFILATWYLSTIMGIIFLPVGIVIIVFSLIKS